MEENSLVVQEQKKRNLIILVVGGVVGALVGLASAFLLVKNAEKDGEPVEMDFGEGIRLVVIVFGLIRSISTLHKG